MFLYNSLNLAPTIKKKNFQIYFIYLLIILSVEPSAQSKAKIALSKADKSVGWTVSAAYRFAKDMMRRVDQENSAFYTAGQSPFTDGLLVVALLLAFVLVFLMGYCIGSRRRRQVASIAPKAVTRHGGQQFTGDGGEQVSAGGGERATGNGNQQVTGDGGERATENGSE